MLFSKSAETGSIYTSKNGQVEVRLSAGQCVHTSLSWSKNEPHSTPLQIRAERSFICIIYTSSALWDTELLPGSTADR